MRLSEAFPATDSQAAREAALVPAGLESALSGYANPTR